MSRKRPDGHGAKPQPDGLISKQRASSRLFKKPHKTMRVVNAVRIIAVSTVATILFVSGCLGPGGPEPSTPAGPGAQTHATFLTTQVNTGGFEPRIAVGPDGTRWVSTQDKSGPEVVYSSTDGGRTWQRTPTDPPAASPCCDNEIAVTPTGRVLTSIITGSAGSTQLDIQYTDDGGKTWTSSRGNALADQDRQWLAVGTKDPSTDQYLVYMLWHNLLSGSAQHEMFVSTSHDGGATFGPAVPITLPGSQAWNDLQCADSGGPSNIFANPKTGQVYAVFGTRSSALGGCGASATQQFEINVVAATRMWVATSNDQGVTWTNSLAVDDSAAGNIIGMQVDAGTIDHQGNVYVVYPESPQPYPNYDGAAVKYVWAAPDLGHWSKPITVEQQIDGGKQPGTGHILTHIVAGDPGKVALFYLKGEGTGNKSLWYPTVALTWNGLEAAPQFEYTRVSIIPAWQGTASQLMGVCNPFGERFGPLSPAVNAAAGGFTCGRSSDVYGQALDASCGPTFVWYADSKLNNESGGTYVTQQTAGPTLCTAQEATAHAT
ncbi:MAG: exo-alpha-sialidase [Candidatus Thermoplasmatota archaeon]